MLNIILAFTFTYIYSIFFKRLHFLFQTTVSLQIVQIY